MTESELIAEQLRHTIDLLRAELNAVRAQQQHDARMLGHQVSELQNLARDHENRLRNVSEGVTHFRVLAGLATGGGLLALLSLFKVLYGGG